MRGQDRLVVGHRDGAGAVLLGVRHHSPACARLVADTIAAVRPAYVLVEGPADMNDRIDELFLGHELPIAIFTSYRDHGRHHMSWSPLCEYSPEWVALAVGRRHGAEVRFIDLPAWHPAFAGRRNRYADAERRYVDAVDRLCRAFAVDNPDTLWDHMVEVEPYDGLAERLATYFDLVRGEAVAGEDDTTREAYMAQWITAALAHADGRPVVVVTGGFHRPALARLVTDALAKGGPGDGTWPEVPQPPANASASSYLVPYSFKRLDAFDGYESGMPSPGYYQWVWDHGPAKAANVLMKAVVTRLRKRRQVVSTADLIAARATAAGLARLRGHHVPARTDVLDGLVSALVTDALEVPLPWTGRGRLAAGTHPVVVEMVAALGGGRVGRLHPDTPLPPLVHDVTAELERHQLDRTGQVPLDLTDDADLARSRVLHRLRVLRIPGFRRDTGPDIGTDAILAEEWTLTRSDGRLVALIEAGRYGARLSDAATAKLTARTQAVGKDVDGLAEVLFDAVWCGSTALADEVLNTVAQSVHTVTDIGALGRMLAVVVGLWRHDRLLGTAGSTPLGAVIDAAVTRLLWLTEGIRGGAAPADPDRLTALVAVRDAVVHAEKVLSTDRSTALEVMRRVAADGGVPPDLRGAAFGFCWSLGDEADAVRAIRGVADPKTLGDWLAGLFALAREPVLEAEPDGGVLAVLDGLVAAMSEHDFLVALPALRQAFAYFPPRERETIARHLLAHHGYAGSARDLLRLAADPMQVAQTQELEARVEALLVREGLLVPQDVHTGE